MTNWRWDNPHALRDQVELFYQHKMRYAKVRHSSVQFSWYGTADQRANIEQPSCWGYNLGDFLPGISLIWDWIIYTHDDDGNWADPGVVNGRRSRLSNCNDDADSECEEHTHCCEHGTWKVMGT